MSSYLFFKRKRGIEMIDLVQRRKSLRTGDEIIAAILKVCGSVQVGRNVWLAKRYEDPVHATSTAVGVRIGRERRKVKRFGFFQKLMQRIEAHFEPIIIIPPIFGHLQIHSIQVQFIVGEQRFCNTDDFLVSFLFGKDLQRIKDLLKESAPEIVIS